MMRKRVAFLVAFLMVMMLIPCTVFGEQSDPVSIPDPNLEWVIRQELGKPTGALTRRDLETLAVLEGNDEGIVNLEGLQYATNLEWLFLWENHISDIGPLAGLTSLSNIWLFSNQISDISPLAGLINLNVLSLSYNQISDISLLAGLTSLEELDLDDNKISDISPLAGLTSLTELWLFNNQISDISPLAGLSNIMYLVLSYNYLDISPGSAAMDVIESHLDRGAYVDYEQQKTSNDEPTATKLGVERVNATTLRLTGDRANQYRFDVRVMGQEDYIMIRDYSTEPVYEWSGAQEGQLYEMVAHGLNSQGGAYTGYYVVFANVPAGTPVIPYTDVSLSVQQVGGDIHLTATPVGGSNVIYKFEYALASDVQYQDVRGFNAYSPLNSYVLPGLQAGQEYYFVVHAVDITDTSYYVYHADFVPMTMLVSMP